NDFADADDLFLVAGVIEEKLLALFHFLEIAARDEVAHAAPHLAFAAALDLIVPGKFFRLGFHQPVPHLRRSSVSFPSVPAMPRLGTAGSIAIRSRLRRSFCRSTSQRPRPRSAYRWRDRAPFQARPAR